MRSALLVFVVLAGLAGTARADSLYVSPTGNDLNPCNLSQPCLTVAHTQTVAQGLIATGLTAPLSVYLRGGTYTQATGLTFGAADSGTSSFPVTWQSYSGEVATISGGQTVTGWTHDTGSIYKAYVGTGWNFRQLYVNGVHVPRTHGSFNPSGWTRTGTGYTPPDDSMMSWGNPTDVTIVSLGDWSEDMGKAAALSTSGSTSTTVLTGSVTDWVYQGPYSMEAGTAFTSDVAGQVTGLRFWRSQLNGGDTGTHTGHLWDNSGNLLATATFSASSATGWSDVTLSSPVSITASTTYVVSYDCTIITVTAGVFPVTNFPMHGSAAVNSKTLGTFPTTPEGTPGGCYWVDVDFQYSAGTTNAITMTNPFWANQQAMLSAYGVRATPSWIENAYELLAANSWYLNRTTGYLYLWLADGSNPANATVVAPVVDHLLTVSGASYLNFGFPASPSNPIVFAYSNWTGPDSTTGYLGIQSGYTYVTYNTVMQLLDAAVTVNASTSVAFNGDEFAHLGSRALLVKGGSSNVSIIGNRFDDNAGGAMQIGDVGTTPHGEVSFEKESGITVYGNTISAGNAFDYQDNGAIFAPAMTGSTIASNRLDNTPWIPIAIGWGWGSTAFATNNTVSRDMRLWQWFLFVGSLFLLHWGLRNLWCHYSQKVKRTLRRALLALVLLAGLAGTARAGSLYVSPTGGDSNPCSLSLPCLTVAHVQSVIQTAETVCPSAPFSGDCYYFVITPTTATNQDLVYDLSLAPAEFWFHVRSDGGDIRVTTQDGTTQVAREVSAFNSTTHTGALYINTNGGAATSFYVYSGNAALTEPGAGSQYGKRAVWESAAKAVWHLEDTSDSSQAVSDGAVTTASQLSAKIGGGYSFDGRGNPAASYLISLGTTASLNFPSAFTMHAWYRANAHSSDGDILGKFNGSNGDGYGLFTSPAGISMYVNGAVRLSTGALAAGWHEIVATWNGTSIILYVDGSPVGSPYSYAIAPNSAGQTGFIGGYTQWATGSDIDEVRMYSRALSAGEITQMYADQNAPGTFWTTSTETSLSIGEPVNVYLRAGTYQQATGLTFNAADSGVTWQSYPGENAVISGGAPVTGWSLYSGGIYRANVGMGWNFRQLYVNGVHAQRARGPSNPAGWTRTATGYTAPDTSMSTWDNPTAIEIVSLCSWEIDRLKVTSIAGSAVTMSSTGWTNQQLFYAGHGCRSTPSWVENAYELMAPGYWYLDQATGYLYYWPPSGSMTDVTVVAPVVDHLLTVSGASTIQFGTAQDPLTFSYSNWTGPDSALGYLGGQSGCYYGATTNICATLDAAVTVNASNNITFIGNEFSHLGSRGILVTGQSANVVINGNNFEDNAAGALQLGDPGSCSGGCLPVVQESNITVINNLISSGNAFDYIDNGAIFAPALTGSTIAHNEIDDTPWVPIAIGWGGWGGVSTAYATNNSIIGNYINNPCIGPVINADCGGIYSNGAQTSNSSYATGLVVNGNYMRGGSAPDGLYPDESSSWSAWSNNVVQSTTSQWLHIWIASINNLQITNNYTDNATLLNSGTNITISGTVPIATGTQSFGTPQQAIICGAGVPGATACTTPTLWPTWQSGVGATWTRPQIGP